jgi:hypothetical protein
MQRRDDITLLFRGVPSMIAPGQSEEPPFLGLTSQTVTRPINSSVRIKIEGGQFLMQSFRPRARNDHGDSDLTYGNGWAILKTRNQITGAEFNHRGDNSTFTAQSC